MKRNWLFVCLSLVCGVSYAGGQINETTIENVRVDKSGLGFVKFSQPLTGPTVASCIDMAGNFNYHLSFDTNAAGGKSVLSLALTAQATGMKITASGTGTCNEYVAIESWDHGYTTPPQF